MSAKRGSNDPEGRMSIQWRGAPHEGLPNRDAIRQRQRAQVNPDNEDLSSSGSSSSDWRVPIRSCAARLQPDAVPLRQARRSVVLRKPSLAEAVHDRLEASHVEHLRAWHHHANGGHVIRLRKSTQRQPPSAVAHPSSCSIGFARYSVQRYLASLRPTAGREYQTQLHDKKLLQLRTVA